MIAALPIRPVAKLDRTRRLAAVRQGKGAVTETTINGASLPGSGGGETGESAPDGGGAGSMVEPWCDMTFDGRVGKSENSAIP